MRTTIDIDAPILQELKRRQRTERKSLGAMVSELLARALAEDRSAEPAYQLTWISRPLGPALIDLEDKDALYAILDSE
jgi:hypothetical protein